MTPYLPVAPEAEIKDNFAALSSMTASGRAWGNRPRTVIDHAVIDRTGANAASAE